MILPYERQSMQNVRQIFPKVMLLSDIYFRAYPPQFITLVFASFVFSLHPCFLFGCLVLKKKDVIATLSSFCGAAPGLIFSDFELFVLVNFRRNQGSTPEEKAYKWSDWEILHPSRFHEKGKPSRKLFRN